MLKVYVIHSPKTEVIYGAYTKIRKAEAAQELLQRQGIVNIIEEVQLNKEIK